MFDPHFTSRLETDNRTIWASRLDDEQLAGLIWALGDFSCRCCFLTELLDDHRAEIDPADTDYARARALLQRLSDLVNEGRSSVPPWQLIADAIGPQRFWASRTRPIITGEFRRRLEESKGKYFPWALNLTEDHLFAILATIGELAPFTYLIVAQLDRHQTKVFARVAYARAGPFSRLSPRWPVAPGIPTTTSMAASTWRYARRKALAQAGLGPVDRLSPGVRPPRGEAMPLLNLLSLATYRPSPHGSDHPPATAPLRPAEPLLTRLTAKRCP